MPDDMGPVAGHSLAVSPALAQLWLRQQQAPEQVLAQRAVWRVEGAESGALAAAWARLWAQTPALRLAFDLDETGAVTAHPQDGLAPLDVVWAEDAAGAARALPVPPLGDGAPLVRLTLIAGAAGPVLVLDRHDLLAEAAPMAELMVALEALLPGRAAGAGGPDWLWAEGPAPGREAPAPADPAPVRSGVAPAHPDPAPAHPDPAQHDLESALLAEFRLALNRPDLGPEDDFFDHGGHSLLATRVIGRMFDRHGVEIAFDDIFAHATAARLATRARRAVTHPGGPLVPPPPADPAMRGNEDAALAGHTLTAATTALAHAPLSLAQESLWKASAAHGHGAVFNLPFLLRFGAPVDEAAFGRAFRDLMIRHPVLRSLFVETPAGVTQHVVPEGALDSYDWFRDSTAADGTTPEREAAHPFDLAHELPLRLRFLRDAAGVPLLSFLVHHIVLDEWSLNQLMAELGEAYAARSAGHAPVWADQPPPFDAFARAQRAAGGMAPHLRWWLDHLRDLPAPQKIADRRAAEAPTPPDAASPDGPPPRGLEVLRIDPTMGEGLRRAARRLEASLFNLFHAALAAALHVTGGVTDLPVGTSASGRNDPRWFDTVGYFTTVICHRLQMTPDMTLAELVAHSRDLVARSLPHSEIPIDLVEEALAGGAPVGAEHIFEVFVQIHAGNALNGALPGPDGPIPYRQVELGAPPSILPLHVEVMEDATVPSRDLTLTLNHRADRYPPPKAAAIVARLHAALRLLAAPGGPATRLADLPPFNDKD